MAVVAGGRVAFRQEGKMWNAYFARPDTMEGAVWIGSIALVPAKEHEDIKLRFMELMKEATARVLASKGLTIEGWRTQSAPPGDRSGSS